MTLAEGATTIFLTYAWLIPLFPLLGAALTMWIGPKLKQGGGGIIIGAIGLSLVWSLLVFRDVLAGSTHHASWDWITLSTHTIGMGILVDHLSGFLMALVSFLALLIVIYSWSYMSGEGTARRRYYAAVGLFVSGMLGTVLADNFLLMFIFWEIMGLCSYLLIGFWFQKKSAADASLKAFLVTRLGDVMLLVGFTILFVHFGTFEYRLLFERAQDAAQSGALDTVPMTFAGLMIFGGAVGKSAQFPLHVWLPDAMEGPTTVSALIHAATMVKAGVFLVARSYPIFVHTPDVFVVIGVIGGFTAFFAATMALVMYDIKRVLAYSTLSQLGYMFLGLGAGGILLVHHHSALGYAAGLFHLMNHAFFKALLFLGAGSVGHAFHHAANPYDMRQMGGLHSRMKTTSITMLIGSIAIAGIPPLAGFWSKDEVLAAAFNAGSDSQALLVMWVLGVLTALMTAFYMFRMWFGVFSGKPRSHDAEEAHESPRSMTTPLVILAFFALVSGLFWLVPWGDAGGMEPYLAHDLEVYTPTFYEHHDFHATEFLVHLFSNPLTYVSLAAAIVGILVAKTMYHNKGARARWDEAPTGMRKVLTNRWYLNAFTVGLGRFFATVIGNLAALIDRYVIDGIVNGLANVTDWKSGWVRKWQTGNVTTYAATIIISVAVIMILLQFVFPSWPGLTDWFASLNPAGGP